MKNQNKVLSYLGLAARAGKVQSGNFSTEKAVKAGKAFVVIASGDASDNTKKQFRNMSAFYEVPFFTCGDKESLGKAIGKELRSSLAVTDENLAAAIIRELEKDGEPACERT